jgi:cbb3-type cytochrome oxidase subunit 3
MPGRASAEVIFIAAMMILIMIISIGAVYFFFKTYKKEMRDKEVARQKKEDAQ